MHQFLIIFFILFISFFAQANPNNSLYGDFRYTVGKFESKDSAGIKTNFMKANNNGSRLGFKGSYSEGELKALYHYELGAVNDSGGSGVTSRFYYAGLNSEKLGTLKYGRMSTPYKMAGRRVDPFYDTSAGKGNAGAMFGLSSNLTNGWTNNSINYWSPEFQSLTLNAGVYLADQKSTSADYNVGLRYNKEGIDAGVQFARIKEGAAIANSTARDEAIRLHTKYTTDKWSLGFSYETFDSNSGNDANYIYTAGTYSFFDDTKLAVSYGNASDTGNVALDGNGFAVGVFHQLMSKTEVHILFSNVDLDDNSMQRTIAIGINHKFSWEI